MSLLSIALVRAVSRSHILPRSTLLSGGHITQDRNNNVSLINSNLDISFRQFSHNNASLIQSLRYLPISSNSHSFSRTFSTSQACQTEVDKTDPPPAKTGIVARFKQMCKDYWYVLVPVHMATSVVWFGSFYLLVKSGIDVTSLLSSLGVTEAYLDKIASSEWSYVALASACYKLASPARYTVTVGTSTVAVKYLKEWGYLKTSKEVATDFKHKMDNVEGQVKGKWEEYAEKRRHRKGLRSRKRNAKTKKE